MSAVSTQIKLDLLPIGKAVRVEVEGRKIGLYHQEDGIYALDDVCPHRDAPLHEGFVHSGQVQCPWHQWTFRLTDGLCTNLPRLQIKSYKVDVRDGEIWLNL